MLLCRSASSMLEAQTADAEVEVEVSFELDQERMYRQSSVVQGRQMWVVLSCLVVRSCLLN